MRIGLFGYRWVSSRGASRQRTASSRYICLCFRATRSSKPVDAGRGDAACAYVWTVASSAQRQTQHSRQFKRPPSRHRSTQRRPDKGRATPSSCPAKGAPKAAASKCLEGSACARSSSPRAMDPMGLVRLSSAASCSYSPAALDTRRRSFSGASICTSKFPRVMTFPSGANGAFSSPPSWAAEQQAGAASRFRPEAAPRRLSGAFPSHPAAVSQDGMEDGLRNGGGAAAHAFLSVAQERFHRVVVAMQAAKVCLLPLPSLYFPTACSRNRRIVPAKDRKSP